MRRYELLTRAGIRALAPGGNVTEAGITVERLADGDLRFTINIMVDRVRVHRTVGKASEGADRGTAERLIEKLRTEAREGRLSLPRGRKTHLTFGEAARDYLDQLERTGGKLVERKRQHCAARLTPFFRNTALSRITTRQIDLFAAGRVRDGASNATVNRELATLSHLLRRAVEWGWIPEGARPAVRKLPETEGRIIALTDEQCARIQAAAAMDLDADLWLFVYLAFNTSARHSELCRLRWEHLDPQHRRFHIFKAKAGPREQPLSTEVVRVLQKEMRRRSVSSGPVFVAGPGSRVDHRGSFRKAFRRAVVAAGLDPSDIVPHVARHTAITYLVKAGVDLPTVQKVSGHKTLGQVMRYAHVHAPHVDAAIEKLAIPLPAARAARRR